MNKEKGYKIFFYLTSIITDYFPKVGSRILDLSIRNFVGNKLLLKYFSNKQSAGLRK